MPKALRFLLTIAAIALFAATASAEYDDPWSDLQEAIFPGKTIADGAAFMRLAAPERAYDAAVVPVDVAFDKARLPAAVRSLTLIVDKNPAPVAAVFHFTDQVANPSIGIRLRIDQYTNLHAVAETADGRLYGVAKFVKAAGGCSAPATKSPEEARAHKGQMKLKTLQQAFASRFNRMELMIRHPNNSGLQMDPLTRYYVPADFVQKIDISLAGKPVLSVEGNISISENPAIQFWLKSGAAGDLKVEAEDSSGRKFDATWPLPLAS
ncbi:MAG TPA: quinoprotein dehydrogenase-associated SoxYZ-like carrier [Ferrovibrio sp.]|uniref:quinoprotein dehydrogenase-associated SoxYZ-like carrier n=1 Tax=Ferrovibrio sp. TaxID=1917215 RepID=UPI002ECFB87B